MAHRGNDFLDSRGNQSLSDVFDPVYRTVELLIQTLFFIQNIANERVHVLVDKTVHAFDSVFKTRQYRYRQGKIQGKQESQQDSQKLAEILVHSFQDRKQGGIDHIDDDQGGKSETDGSRQTDPAIQIQRSLGIIPPVGMENLFQNIVNGILQYGRSHHADQEYR